MAQYLMGLDLGSKKGCCLLLDVESGDAVSTCRPWQHLGLQPGIPVVTGGGDAQCGLLGADAVDSGEMGVVAGSTMPMQGVLDRGLIDDEARLWTSHHVVQGRWTLESNGGLSGECPTVRSLRRA